jgi:membrane associated rhomboid family serine protease
MKIHLLALVPLGVIAYFWATFAGHITPVPFELLIWLAGFVAAVIYSRLVVRRMRRRMQD